MTKALTIRLPWPPPKLSPNARPHWRAKHEATQLFKAACFVAIREVIGHAERPEPLQEATAHVTFVVPDERRRDLDNCMAMLKPAFDTMVSAGLLVDDDSKHLKLAAPEMRVVKGERYVEVTLS